MRQIATWSRHGWFLLALILNACTGVTVRAPVAEGTVIYQQRAEKISNIQTWNFSGKISLDDGEQSGSGTLRWDVTSASTVLDFHGAMGRSAWNLHIDTALAVLTEANGNQQSATSVDELVHGRIGWPLPLDALSWWVRGLKAPGPIVDEQYDVLGVLTHLEQFGWRVDINRYKIFDDLQLPVRVEATSGNYRVKLAIGRWHMAGGAQD